MTSRDFQNIFGLFLISVIITVVIPGIVSSIGGTFYEKDIRFTLSNNEKFTNQLRLINEYEKQNAILDSHISIIDAKLNSIDGDSLKHLEYFDELVKIKTYLVNEKSISKPPISIIPFYLNPQMLLWLGIFAAFLLLIYLLIKEASSKFSFSKNLCLLTFVIYLFYEWPLWVRNFILSNDKRTVYAYPNFDIDKYSFFCQEFIILSFCFLAAILIFVSLDIYNTKRNIINQNSDIHKFLIISSYYSSSYKNWFINSLILAMGFLSFTNFFWRLVFNYGDQRYIISAVNAHIIWAVCWVAISLNVLKYLQLFEKTKRDILRNNPDDKTLKIVMDHQPANNLTIIISGIVSLATFLSPLLKMFISH